MLIDSHCHAWERWPYQPPVPDFYSRSAIDQLLFEMDNAGVDKAFLVCAGIEHNPANNEYIAAAVRRHPDRIIQCADVDCSWSDTYHLPGAADRLRQAAERWQLSAFTHYVRGDDDGSWFSTDEGLAFFGVAAELGLIASIACRPQHHPAIDKIAAAFPSMPILIHHLGHPGVGNAENLALVLASAQQPNIHVKMSGFYYSTRGPQWDFPHRDTIDGVVRPLYETFGGSRLCWGSDFPVCRRNGIAYVQALESFRSHCDFVTEADKTKILGGNLAGLLGLQN
ncbi:MAG: amidohydrolase [Caldilineaceae bacterium]|nr:amidohydrolase [Caldilineaceae bacterium]